ncbi:hypothetical protein KR222_007706 [Zaprionus bogoriensis]|nr:hypothetical protein KR222_007706 [Zaprionus bogoriensis]
MYTFWRSLCRILRQKTRIVETSVKIIANRNVYGLATLLQLSLIADDGKSQLQHSRRLRTMSRGNYEASIDSKANHYLKALKVRWVQLQEIPGLFAYQLEEARPSRTLPGEHGFYVELNADRSLKRRAPHTIESMKAVFKPKLFNFNNVDDLEVMLTIEDPREGSEISMIINKSPITKYHTLICPDVRNNLIQRVTPSSLSFCVNFMRSIDDPSMRIGYNSPGALASVNHLHFHLLSMPNDLYIDRVRLQELAGNWAYRLSSDSPTEAVCFVFASTDDEDMVSEKIASIYRLTEWLCENNLPHNIFITQQRNSKNVRLFLFVREKYCVNKNVGAFNVGFCEIVGFIPLGDEERFMSITERSVLKRICDVTGNAYVRVYGQVQNVVNGVHDMLWGHPFM